MLGKWKIITINEMTSSGLRPLDYHHAFGNTVLLLSLRSPISKGGIVICTENLIPVFCVLVQDGAVL